MVVGAGMVLIGILVVGLLVFVWLRSYGREEAATEASFRSPDMHKVAYLVPEGQDPAVLMAALTHAGFRSVTSTEGGDERLLVECEERDRDRVRGIIEDVDRAGPHGPGIPVVGHVRFEDER
jgi:hypothetical protein